MNYTSNHHLPQWVKSDRVRMDDFNAAMANIENGMTANAQAAAAARKEAAALPYAIGTYTGAGTDQSIHIGFRPSYLIINGIKEETGSSGIETFGIYSCAVGKYSNVPSCLVVNNDGFTAKKTNGIYPDLVSKGRKYEYIAFK